MLKHSLRLAASGLLVCCLAAAQSEAGPNVSQRINGIRDLGKKGPSAIPALAAHLNDPDRDVRNEAVKAIVKIDTERSLEPLATAARDKDPEIQIRATDGMVNYYIPGYVAKGLTGPLTRSVRQVKSFFSSRNDQVVDADVVVSPEIAEALSSEIKGGTGVDVRSNAALAAGILRCRATVPALTEALRSKDDELLFEALIALQKIHDPGAAPAAASLTHDLDERIQATALETVGILGAESSTPDVRSALRDARSIRVRRAALEALAMLGKPEDRTTFQQYVQDKSPELKASALEGLGRLREPEDYPVLEQAYNQQNADWRVHLAAAFALVDEGKVDMSDFSPLPYLLENLDVKAHANIATAYLVELARRDDVRKALAGAVPEASKGQKIALCSIFGASRADDVIPVLERMSRDVDSDVALAATKALHILQSRKNS